MGWSANQYSKFLEDRTRAARDLLNAVPLKDPSLVIDAGCGPGNSTALLVERFPKAQVIGIDSDRDMLDRAATVLPGIRFEQAMIEDWQPQRAPDLIYANASLQWVDDHRNLMPRLVDILAPRGVLAVQMPDNLDEPSHRSLRDVASDPRWSDRLAAAREQRKPLLPASQLHALLRPHCSHVDIWRTEYNFELDGVDAIIEWFKGSALRPFLAKLDDAERKAFLAEYRDRIAPQYPEHGGKALLAFPRYFFVATKS